MTRTDVNGTWEAQGGREGVRTTRRATAPVRPGPGIAVPALLGAALLAAFVGTVARVATVGGSDRVMVAQTVAGPQGATLRFDDGGRVVIPPGALDEPRAIVVWGHPDERAVDAVGQGAEVAGGRVYAFEPLDVRFAVPVTLILPAPVRDREVEVVVLAPDGLRRLSGRPDRIAGTIVVRTTSFRFDAESEAGR